MPATNPAPPYPSGWEADVVLRDGGTVHLRPIVPEDADRLVAFHDRQSAESIYYRYFTARPRLSERDLRHLTQIDYHDRVAFVALLADDIVAVGRYERWGGRPAAEVAFFVDDDHAQRGLGTVLLEYLVAAARERGLRTFTASVLPANSKMLTVFSSAGFEVSRTFADGVVEVTFDLDPTPQAEAARDRREGAAESASVRRLFTPSSVAVIGAGASAGGLGHEVVYNLLAQRFTGTVWAVNDRADVVCGLASHRAVLDIPADIDLAVVATPAERVLEAVEQCVRRHVRALVILTAGFSETGPEGAELEAEVVAMARRGGVRVLGPNCLGLVNTDPDVRLHATFAPTEPLPGSIGVLAQSGTLGAAIIDRTRRVGLGLSSFVAAGNRADIGASDLMRYWHDDPRTDGVLLYLESFGRIDRFVRAARALTAHKPVVAVSSGSQMIGPTHPDGIHRPDPAARLQQRVAAAIFRQTGIVRVSTLQQLLDVGRLLAAQGVPPGTGVAVVGNSGGAVDLSVGECAAAGMSVVHSVRLSWRAGAADYARALEAALADAAVASVLVVHAPPELRPDPAVNEVILEAAAAHPERVITACNFDAADVSALSFGDVTVPVYEFPEHAAQALGRLAGYWAWRQARRGGAEPSATEPLPARPAVSADGEPAGDDDPTTVERAPHPNGAGPAEAAAAVAGALLARLGPGEVPLGEDDRLFDAAGVTMAPRAIVTDPAAAPAAAATVGFPVAVKGATRDRVLRSEAGGVVLDLPDGESVQGAAERLVERFGAGATPLVLQTMIDRGIDVAVVLRRRDRVTTITVGPGGTTADEDDAALGVLPASATDLAMLVGSTSVGRALGRTVGTEALVDLLHRLAALVEAAPEVSTLVANPVIVGPAGAVVADAVIELAHPTGGDLAARRLDLDPAG
ncbi:MAG: GNAT family N-acetyltransferase [Microthrixaceae bacterium]